MLTFIYKSSKKAFDFFTLILYDIIYENTRINRGQKNVIFAQFALNIQIRQKGRLAGGKKQKYCGTRNRHRFYHGKNCRNQEREAHFHDIRKAFFENTRNNP